MRLTELTIKELKIRKDKQDELWSSFDYLIKDPEVLDMLNFAADSVGHMNTIANYIYEYQDRTSFDDLRRLLDLIVCEVCELTVTGEDHEE